MKAILFAVLGLLAPWAYADWQYRNDTDKMTSKAAKFAILESNNSLDLPFPYRGKNYGRLQVRQHPKFGLDVIVMVDKGQIMCSSYSGCPITVRFDDNAPIRFSGTEPADHSSDTVFVQGAQRFITQAQKAKRILVELTMYQAGNQVLEFHSSSPLEWSRK